jgi:hypothetical protein
MASLKTNVLTVLLILLGVIILPVLFIWSADSIFVLTIKTFIAAFFVLLLIRLAPRGKGATGDQDTGESGEDA